MLERLRVVLVNTSHPGNIGATARAMKNMGLSQLYLVEPLQFPSDEAHARAAGAGDVLQQAQVVGSLEQALAGCRLAFGCSARVRHLPWPLLEPQACAEQIVSTLGEGAEVALVFGREHSGLTNDELQRCQFHVHIPADPAYSSLNLAAAVQVLSYEVRMAWLAAQDQPSAVVEEEWATADELERFYQHLQQALVTIGFLDPARPRQLMPQLRRLYGRAGVTRQEMNILRGILTETEKAARAIPGQQEERDV